jgi:hypothetical protein
MTATGTDQTANGLVKELIGGTAFINNVQTYFRRKSKYTIFGLAWNLS